MSNINDSNDRQAIVPKTPSAGLRWRIIPGTFLSIFAVLGSIGFVVEIFTIVHYNMKYGWIEVDPRNPSLSRLAISPVNVLVIVCGTLGVLAAGLSAYAWFYGRWRFAWIGTVCFFALMLTAKWLESL